MPSYSRACLSSQIILRARQTHLLEQFILQHPTLTSAVVENVRSAWLAYFAKNLSGTLEGSEPASFEDARRVFAEQIIAKAQQDKAWADKQAAKDEKFTMHMSTLSEGLRALDAAAAETSGAEAVAQLVNGNRDPLGASLDKLVRARLAATPRHATADQMTSLAARSRTPKSSATLQLPGSSLSLALCGRCESSDRTS